MKIVLAGYMASGKSTIGKVLAKKLDLNFIDLDHYIVEKEGQTVKEIFKNEGEIYFRKKETEYLEDIIYVKDNFVLSLGGGTPCYANNMDQIVDAEGVTSFYLKAGTQTLFDRLKKEKQDRPLISEISDEKMKEFISIHIYERGYYYNKADFTIKVDEKDIDETVKEIIVELKQMKNS